MTIDDRAPWLPGLPPLDAPLRDHAYALATAGLELMPRRATHDGRLIDALTGSPRTGLIGETEVAAYLAAHPATGAWAVVCGPTSGVLVLDVDQHPGGDDGLATLRELERQHGSLPAPPVVLSPTGSGRHLYFAWPSGRVRNGPITRGEGEAKVNLAPGVEVLGGRMAANLPPSRKAAGPYRWSLARHPSYLPLPPVPPWLLVMIQPPEKPRPLRLEPGEIRVGDAYVRAALDGELAAIAQASPGIRNATLSRSAWAIARLVTRGALDTATAERELVAAGVANGLRQHEATSTVRSALRGRAGS